MTSIEIRHGQIEDATASFSLFRQVVSEDRFFAVALEEMSRTMATQEALFYRLTTKDNSGVWVAFTNEEIVGQLSVLGGSLMRTHHIGEVEMFVHPDVRGRGIGSELLAHALSWCTSNEYLQKLELSVISDNHRAISLYTRHGFVQEGCQQAAFIDLDKQERDRILMGRFVR